MTVTAQTTRFSYTANGATTVFAYLCRVLQTADLAVYLNGVLQLSGYSVSGIGADAGGNVTFAVAPANGVIVVVQRLMTVDRQTDYQYGGPFNESTVDLDQDRQTMLIQQVNANLARAIQIPDGETTTTTTPSVANRASKYLVFDALGNVSVSAGSGADTGLRTDLANTSNPALGDFLLGVKSVLANAVARTQHDKNADKISVKDFGAVGDGVTDDTTAIQNAINTLLGIGSPYCCGLYIPYGKYKLTAPLVINTSSRNFSMAGDGPLSSQFITSSATNDVFQLTTCPQAKFSDFGIQQSVEMTGGSFFNCSGLYRVTFENLYLAEYRVAWTMQHCSGVLLNNIQAVTASLFTDVTYKGGSCHIYFKASASGANNGIAINNFAFDPSSLTPATGSKLAGGFYFEHCDGVWISNGHVAGSYLGHILISTIATYNVNGVKFTNVWTDYYGTTNVRITAPVGAETVSDITFSNCHIQGASGNGVEALNGNLDTLVFDNTIFEFCGQAGANITAGRNIKFTGGCSFRGNNGSVANGSTLIFTGTNTHGLISDCDFNAGPSVFYNIDTGASTPKLLIGPNTYKGASVSDVYVTGTAINFQINGGVSESFSSTFASAATLPIPMIGSVFYITGATNITAFAANAGFKQREITLVFLTAGVTITPSASLIRNAGVYTSTANSAIKWSCINGVVWTALN